MTVSICTACGEIFRSVPAFDKHRVGKYPTETEPSTRRCLTTDEMIDAGFSLDKWDKWGSGGFTMQVVAKMKHTEHDAEGDEDGNVEQPA